MEKQLKTCFVACPIGDAGSQVRRQSDCLLEYIIKPSLEGHGYCEPVRVDKSDKPAHITTEIIQNLISSDLVIADLSTLNPNVFYELGIRHAFKKPCILVSDWKDRPPFDVAGINTIKYVYDDPNSHSEVITRIRDQLTAFGNKNEVSNPVTIALGFGRLEESGDDIAQLFVQMSEKIEFLASKVDESTDERFREAPMTSVSERKKHFSVGHRVRHAKFGRGLVVGVGGEKLSIEFDTCGMKTIVAKFVEHD